MSRSRCVLLALLASSSVGAGSGCSAPATSPPDQRRALPADFVGLISPETFVTTGEERRRLMRRQREAGVRLLRQTFDWAAIEIRHDRYDLGAHDDYVADASAAGLSVMPVLFNPPAFRSRGRRDVGAPTPPPSDPRAMARFARALVRRYGTRGTLWTERPGLPRRPIRAWQVWNEPNLPSYWGGRPSATGYARLLRLVGAAIRQADSRALVITGGIPDSRLGIPFDEYVRQLVRAAGPDAFDVLAIHPYSRTPAGVVAAVTAARRLLSSGPARDANLWVSELGWASGGPRSEFTVGPQVQAEYVRTALIELGRRADELGVSGVVYYNWRDAPPYAGGRDFWGLHTGLLHRDGSPKPAFDAFREAVAGLTED